MERMQVAAPKAAAVRCGAAQEGKSAPEYRPIFLTTPKEGQMSVATKTRKPQAPKTQGSGGDGDPQHLRALARANEVRLARADLKRRIASGDCSVCEPILETPTEADGMTVSELLTSQRRWGRARCRKLLSRIGLSENKRLGTLTERQRKMLCAALGSPAAE